MAAFRTSWLREWRQTDEVTFSGQKSPPKRHWAAQRIVNATRAGCPERLLGRAWALPLSQNSHGSELEA